MATSVYRRSSESLCSWKCFISLLWHRFRQRLDYSDIQCDKSNIGEILQFAFSVKWVSMITGIYFVFYFVYLEKFVVRSWDLTAHRCSILRFFTSLYIKISSSTRGYLQDISLNEFYPLTARDLSKGRSVWLVAKDSLFAGSFLYFVARLAPKLGCCQLGVFHGHI